MSRVARRLGAAVALLAIAGCAETVDPESTSIATQAAKSVVDEVYSHIYRQYIDPVSVDEMSMSGLKGVSGIDSALRVKRADGVVWLSSDDVSLAKFQAPAQNDIDGWSALTIKVLDASRGASDKVRGAPREKLFEAIFDSALSDLDRFSRYATPEEASDIVAQREGFGGIGIRIRIADSLIRVVSVTPDSPAARAGVRADDAISRIDGVPSTGMNLRQVVKRLRGRRGTKVAMTFVRDNSAQPLKVLMVRRHIVPVTVTSRREDGVLYVRLSRFNRRTASTLADAVNNARDDMGSGFRGLILDIRNNPGGLLDQAVEVADLFLDKGRIVTTEGRHPGSFQRYDAEFGDILGGRPIVVMVNGRSASSSEIVAAALQDLGRAVVIGSNSYGKGTVQSVFPLRNHGELTLTWSRFHAPSGYALHNLGVMPTVCTSGARNGADKSIAKLRGDREATLATMAEWRTHRVPNMAATTDLRAICPASVDTGGDTDVELDVARQVIADSSLYGRALVAYTGVAKAETARPTDSRR
jgi:carboxyl-terminal processing protease